MLHNIYRENEVNCVLKRRLVAVGPFSHNKSHIFKMKHFQEYNTHKTFEKFQQHQIDVVVMGYHLEPTLANLFLVYHECKWLESCPIRFQSKYYRK